MDGGWEGRRREIEARSPAGAAARVTGRLAAAGVGGLRLAPSRDLPTAG